jgi:hypothetical protein
LAGFWSAQRTGILRDQYNRPDIDRNHTHSARRGVMAFTVTDNANGPTGGSVPVDTRI